MDLALGLGPEVGYSSRQEVAPNAVPGERERESRMTRFVIVLATLVLTCLPTLGQASAKPRLLRISVSATPTTFDPARIIDLLHQRHFQQVFESPLRAGVGADGKITVVPGLCEWLPVDAERKVVRLKMMPGATFQADACFEGGKGRAVTPQDVVFSLLRIADPEIPSPAWKLFLEGRVDGLDSWREKATSNRAADYDAIPSGFRVDGDTVVITLTRPFPQLRALLTQTWASIVPIEAFRKYGRDLSEHPVGTGPFRVIERTQFVTRFSRHRDGRGLHDGNIEELRLEPVSDPEAVATRFIAGELDAVELLAPQVKFFLNADRTLLPAMKGKGVTMQPTLPLTTAYLVFNCGSPVLSKKGIREAMALSLDRDAIVKAGFTGYAKRTDSPLPLALPEQDMIKNTPWSLARRDVLKAKAALQREGFGPEKQLPPLDFVFTDFGDPRITKAVDLMVRQSAEVGITLVPKVEQIGPFMDRLGRGDFGIAWTSWFIDYPDAENYFQLFTTDKVSGSWGANYGHFASPEVDRLYEEFCLQEPGLNRMNVSGRLLEKIRDEVAWVPIAEISEWTLLGKGVKGMGPHVLNWCLGSVSK